jgi:ABC-type glycerol-3-phosphate transport system substrate-binding protein
MRFRWAWMPLVLGVSAAVCAAARPSDAETHFPEGNRGANLEQVKTLAGEWEGKHTHGKAVHAREEWPASSVV